MRVLEKARALQNLSTFPKYPTWPNERYYRCWQP